MKKYYIITLILLCFYFLQTGCKKSTDPPPVIVPDTTTHNYEWTIHQFGTGAGSSYLYDVFAISDSNVWAVGKINTNEQDSLGNDLDPYNAIHWDGQNWELRWIETEYRGDMIAPPLEGIFAFSSDDIWATSGVPRHWNGSGWTLYHLWDMGILGQEDGGVPNIWGTSSNDIYFAGRTGTLVHYNGSDWTKLDSGTDMNIGDICGFSNGDFYAVAGTDIAQPNEFLIYNNGQLQNKISHNENSKNSLWGSSATDIYTVGEGIFHFNGNSLQMLEWPNNVPKILMSSVRGSASNNIFICGHFAFIMHYNGMDWYYYENLYNQITLKSISVLENQVFAIGTDGYNAFVYHGKKVTN
jgi:hypothetical protein